MIRDRFSTLVVGRNGSGKSTWSMNFADQLDARAVLVVASKVPNRDDRWKKFRRLEVIEGRLAYKGRKVKDLLALSRSLDWGVSNGRYNWFVSVGNEIMPGNSRVKETLYGSIMQAFASGGSIALFDDFRDYEDASMSIHFRKMLRAVRQQGNDVILMAHSFQDVPPSLWGNTQALCLFATTDDFSNPAARNKTPQYLRDWIDASTAYLRTAKPTPNGEPPHMFKMLNEQLVRG
jgi:KaiC/GvpD/RAD55 family RecA-like ATPase